MPCPHRALWRSGELEEAQNTFTSGGRVWHNDKVIQRAYWLRAIEEAWMRRPIVWLWGLPGTGKTFLANSMTHALVFDCARPEVQERLSEPVSFFSALQGLRVILDHIHHLKDPNALIARAIKYFPEIKILAVASIPPTGGSKAGDDLAGKRGVIHLMPMTLGDLDAFGVLSLETRLLHGGLPSRFTGQGISDRFKTEWMARFWDGGPAARYGIRRRIAFEALLNYMWAHSPVFEDLQTAATVCGIAPETAGRYIRAMVSAGLIIALKPYAAGVSAQSGGRARLYAFDAGFAAHARGWSHPGTGQWAVLWKHCVLNELASACQGRGLHYWRGRRGHEVDFVLARKRGEPTAVMCAWPSESFDPAPLKAFRRRYPKGHSWVVSPDILLPFHRAIGRFDATFTNLEGLARELEAGA